MIYDGKNIQKIADRIGIHRTTIDCGLKHTACGAKSKWASELAYQIECELEDNWSPEQIANIQDTVSFKTIYHCLYNDFLNVFKQCLRHKGNKRKREVKWRSNTQSMNALLLLGIVKSLDIENWTPLFLVNGFIGPFQC